MYINFESVICAGITPLELLNLIQISSRFEPNGDLANLEDKGFVKNGKITKAGRSFLINVSNAGSSELVNKMVLRLIDLYEDYSDRIGNKLAIKANLAWFREVTGFKDEAIIATVENYLSETDSQFIKNLDNLIYKSPNVFSTKKSLRDSYLYKLMTKDHNLNLNFYDGSKSVVNKFIFDVTKLKIPKRGANDLYFTGSKEGDLAHQLKIRDKLHKMVVNV